MLKFSHFSPLEFEISTWVTGKGMGEVWKVHGNYSIILYSCFTEVSLSQVWFFMLSEEKTVFFSFWCPLRNACQFYMKYFMLQWIFACYMFSKFYQVEIYVKRLIQSTLKGIFYLANMNILWCIKMPLILPSCILAQKNKISHYFLEQPPNQQNIMYIQYEYALNDWKYPNLKFGFWSALRRGHCTKKNSFAHLLIML